VDTSTGEAELVCDRTPSGMEPGSVRSSFVIGTVATDIALTDDALWIVGHTSTFTNLTIDRRRLDGNWSGGFMIPSAGVGDLAPRRAIGLGDRVVFAVDIVQDPGCEWCNERWLVAYDDVDEISVRAWDLVLEAGSWDIARTDDGTILVASVASEDGVTFTTTLQEIDRDGNVMRSETENGISVHGPMTRLAVGALDDVLLIGHEAGLQDGWMSHWASDFDLTSSSTEVTTRYALGSLPNGDNLQAYAGASGPVLERASPQLDTEWTIDLDVQPRALVGDCDEGFVVAGGSVSRLDGAGNVQWSTPVIGVALSAVIDEAGDVLALVQTGSGQSSVTTYVGH
jgi:hypothetical protein